jgi:hypothetical protein
MYIKCKWFYVRARRQREKQREKSKTF